MNEQRQPKGVVNAKGNGIWGRDRGGIPLVVPGDIAESPVQSPKKLNLRTLHKSTGFQRN